MLNKEEWGQIFENNFDCYADTYDDQNIIIAMTKERFIETVIKTLLENKWKK